MHKNDFLKKLDQHVHEFPEEWHWSDENSYRLVHYTGLIFIQTYDFSTYVVESHYDGMNFLVIAPTDKIDLYAIFQRFLMEKQEEEDALLANGAELLAVLEQREMEA